MARNVYSVRYKMYPSDDVHLAVVIASNKVEAYDQAIHGEIPYRNKGEHAYSAWVTSVTYQNGNERKFNTHEGKPY